MIRKTLLESGILVLLSVICAALTWAVHPDKPPWHRLPLEEGAIQLETILADGLPTLWIDARTEEEYSAGHIPKAILLNEEQWDMQLDALLDRWKPGLRVVVYCNAESCQTSKHVARRIREEMGFENVYFLRGGWQAWIAKEKQ